MAGDISDVGSSLETLQHIMSTRVIEWSRTPPKASKIFQIASANINYEVNSISDYNSLRWCKSYEIIGNSVENVIEGAFASFIHIYVTCCKNGDEYDEFERHRISKWISEIRRSNDEASFLILHFLTPDVSISVKNFFSRSVFDRIKRDFLNRQKMSINCTCAQIFGGNSARSQETICEVADIIISMHKKSLHSYMQKSEYNFLVYWGAIKTHPEWSISYYFSNSFKLYTFYNSLNFSEEICELYSSIFSNIFEYLRTTDFESMPRSLKAAFLGSKSSLELDSDDEKSSVISCMVSGYQIPIDPVSSPPLKGQDECDSLISILFHIVGANIYLSLYHKNYSKLFNDLCDFVLELKPLLNKISSKISENVFNYFILESCSWILKSLFKIINFPPLMNYYNDNDSKPSFTLGVCRILSLLCQILFSSLHLYSSINLHSLRQVKYIKTFESLPFDENLWDEIPMENFPQRPLKKMSADTNRSFSHKNRSKSVSNLLKNSNKNIQFKLSQVDINREPSGLPHGFNVPFSHAKICLEKIITALDKIPRKPENSETEMSDWLTNCCLVVYYNTSLLFFQCKFNRISTVLLYETAKLYSMAKNVENSIKMFSHVIVHPKIYLWKNFWLKVLILQLNSLCKIQIFTQTSLTPKVLSISKLAASNIYENVREFITDNKSFFIAVSTIFYLSYFHVNNSIPLEVCRIFIKYFKELISEHSFSANIDFRPLISKIIFFTIPKKKFNSATKNSITVNIKTFLPSEISIDSVQLYFRRFSTSNNTNSISKQLSVNLVRPINLQNLSNHIVFRGNDIKLDFGDNIISLANAESAISNFRLEKIEFVINKSILFYKFRGDEIVAFHTEFAPPSFSVPNKVKIVPGFANTFTINAENYFADFTNAQDFEIFFVVNNESSVELLSEKIEIEGYKGDLVSHVSFFPHKQNITHSIDSESNKKYNLVLEGIPKKTKFQLLMSLQFPFDYGVDVFDSRLATVRYF